MRAAVHDRYGPPDVVRLGEVPAPEPGDGDLLVRVHATTVNRTDCAYRAARPFFVRGFTGLTRPRRRVLGTEYAGVVEEVGASVTGFSPGDRVFGYNEGPFGAHAEYLAVPASGMVAEIPDGVPFATAACATEGAHYALAAARWLRVVEGERVLVHGATGAIGSAAVQLLKALGAEVTATAPTAHVDTVRDLGADRVVDFETEDFTAGGRTYDVVLDAVGKSTYGRCRRLLTPRGRFASSDVGPYWQNAVLALTTPWLPGRTVRFPVPSEDQEMARWFADLLATGRFRPLIDRHYPLERIVEAYRFVETGRKLGNVVIDVVEP
ncbi:NAD(P)-dependent alcohol dehydrogenase [Nocardiopsis sp. NPDC006139]|uniref:NAD(P)-dependent alcohol dehydrogenase n=1 Tax=Nocardiopsis sp. NPDC006139 TaxID=3154578 RepID=UPI0033A2A608